MGRVSYESILIESYRVLPMITLDSEASIADLVNNIESDAKYVSYSSPDSTPPRTNLACLTQ